MKVQTKHNNTGEMRRLNNLYSYKILDTAAESEFDNLTRLASEIAGTEIAMINFIDDRRQWSKSMVGLDESIREYPREQSLCQFTIEKQAVTEIPNLTDDIRTADFDYINQDGGLRYYFGIPLVTKDNHAIGTLCVLDYEEKKLSETQIRQLKIIADEVMTNLELRKKNQELTSLNETKVQLMKMLSHDMRSPLNGIIGLSSMLREQMKDDHSEYLEVLDIIEQSSSQLNQMVDEVMNYSIIESGELTLNPTDVNLNDIVENTIQLYRPATRIKEIDLQYYTEGFEKPVILDGDKFEQVLGNLLSNAIKYTKPGGWVKLSLIHKKDSLELKVMDSGIGMTEEEMKKILEGQQAMRASKGTEGEKSTGLGLSIIRHIIDLFDGDIDIESEPGKGTTFQVNIPVSAPIK